MENQRSTKPDGHSSTRLSVLPIVGVIWILVVISFYFVAHKPITPDLALAWIRLLGRVAFGLSLVAIAGGIGCFVLRRIELAPIVTAVLQASVGLGILGIGILTFSSVFTWNAWTSWIIMLGGFSFMWRWIRTWLGQWGAIRTVATSWGRMEKALTVLGMLILFVALIKALSPPIKYDALVYHLALPQQYALGGKFSYLSENIFWGMPQIGEMLYLWGIVLGGGELGALLGWFFGILALTGIVAYVAERLGWTSGLVTGVTLLAGFTLADSLSWAYVDWMAILFGTGFIIALDEWWASHDRGYLFLVGALAGFAIGTKYTGGFLALSGVVIIVCRAFISRLKLPQIAGNIIRYSLVVILSSAPWFLKNALSTGNPFYPLLWPAGAMDRFRWEFYNILPWKGVWEAVLLPWQATMTGVEGALGYNASIGPLLLALGPLAWLARRNADWRTRLMLGTAALVGSLGLLSWAIGGRFSGYLIQSRLYFSFFPALAILAGIGYSALEKAHSSGVRWGRLANALILLVVVLNAYDVGTSAIRSNSIAAAVGLETQEVYLGRNLGWYYPAMQGILQLEPGSRVLMLWEPRSYYCLPKCEPDEIIDRWAHDYADYRDEETIAGTWRSQGYTHLLINLSGEEYVRNSDLRYTEKSWQTLDRLLALLTPVQSFGDAYRLFRLVP